MIFKEFYIESIILPSEWKGFEMRKLIGLPNMDRSLYRNNDPATTRGSNTCILMYSYFMNTKYIDGIEILLDGS